MSKTIKLAHAYAVLKMLFLKLTEEQLSVHHCADAVNVFKDEYNRCKELNKPSTLLAVLTRMFEQLIASIGVTCKKLTALNEATQAACKYSRDGIPADVQARNFLLVYA